MNSSNKYVKVMFGDESRAGGVAFKYKIGEVNVSENWNYNDKQNPGGFNFSIENKVARWLVRGDTLYDVSIPDDAEVLEIDSESAPHGVFRTNKIILTNPIYITDELALELFYKSDLPEKSYFKTLAGYTVRGHINAAKEIIRQKVNESNIELAISEFEDFYTPKNNKIVDESYKTESEIYKILLKIKQNKDKKN